MSASEFEAVLGQACIKIDKVLYERGGVPVLEDARRALQLILESARDGKKLKSLRAKLDGASETVRTEMGHDQKLRDDLWDCLDYIDYRL
jgi:hypothetical protein